MRLQEQIQNSRNAGITKYLDEYTQSAIIPESIVKQFAEYAKIKIYTFIDTDIQEELSNFYGCSFQPSRNLGDNMWLVSVN